MSLTNELNHEVILAINKGDIGEVKRFLRHGVDVHANRDHALRYASVQGHSEIVKLLLEHGADIHASDDSSFKSACYYGHLEIVKLLLEHGADLYDETAFNWAEANEKLEVVNYLNNQKMLDKLKQLV
jgi:ankyrin repeat protein